MPIRLNRHKDRGGKQKEARWAAERSRNEHSSKRGESKKASSPRTSQKKRQTHVQKNQSEDAPSSFNGRRLNQKGTEGCQRGPISFAGKKESTMGKEAPSSTPNRGQRGKRLLKKKSKGQAILAFPRETWEKKP